jgi:hypothetical protein
LISFDRCAFLISLHPPPAARNSSTHPSLRDTFSDREGKKAPKAQFIFTKRQLYKNPLRILTNPVEYDIILLKNNAYERIKK